MNWSRKALNWTYEKGDEPVVNYIEMGDKTLNQSRNTVNGNLKY